jgi:hypothetical protein
VSGLTGKACLPVLTERGPQATRSPVQAFLDVARLAPYDAGDTVIDRGTLAE